MGNRGALVDCATGPCPPTPGKWPSAVYSCLILPPAEWKVLRASPSPLGSFCLCPCPCLCLCSCIYPCPCLYTCPYPSPCPCICLSLPLSQSLTLSLSLSLSLPLEEELECIRTDSTERPWSTDTDSIRQVLSAAHQACAHCGAAHLTVEVTG